MDHLENTKMQQLLQDTLFYQVLHTFMYTNHVMCLQLQIVSAIHLIILWFVQQGV